MISKKDLNDLQRSKLRVAAEILQRSSDLYNEGEDYLLPLWAAGVITHGVPKVKKCIIGITEMARKVGKSDRTKDHLYRVTETAKYILIKTKRERLSVDDIEKELLMRSALMITTREENNKTLKEAIKRCKNKDSWEELYDVANIKYDLYTK